MRDIRFRGKRVDNKEYVYGYYCLNPLTQKAYIYSFDNERSYVYEVIPESVGQYTGVNNTFDGDVIQPSGYGGDYYVVEFLGSAFMARRLVIPSVWDRGPRILSDMIEFEVVGNIHDNPELLKGGTSNGTL